MRIIAEQIKPKPISFFVEAAGPALGLAGALLVASAVVSAMGPGAVAGLLAVGGVLLGLLVVADTLVAYRKERYVFSDRQIVRHGGGILRDSQIELNIANITHVQLVLPWPRYRLFGVGQVLIDSAGSGEHLRLRALRDPEAVYAHVRELMRHNGFSLRHSERLHEEQPPVVAVLREIGNGIVGFAVLVFLAFSGAMALVAALPGIWQILAPLVLGVLVIGGAAGLIALRALDLRRRTYTVHDDAVVYTEGFLTRNNAFMPAENLADANTQQSVIDRVLGIYDVTISCQGSGQEIVFRGLRHGPRLSAALESLTSRFKSVTGRASTASPAVPVHDAEATSSQIEPASSTEPEEPGALEREPVERADATFRMHPPRALVPYVLGAVALAVGLPAAAVAAWALEMELVALLGGPAFATLALIGVVFGGVRGVLGIFVTRFELRPRSVKRRYRLLQSHETEYSNEKLTGIVYRVTPFDRFFGTCSIHFWSIGASEPLVFAHVRDRGDLLDRALDQAGIHSERTHEELRSRWSLRATVGESLAMLGLSAVVVVGGVIAATGFDPRFWLAPAAVALFWTGVLVWEPIFYPRCRALFHENHLEVRKGVFFRKRYHALYRNIRHVTTVRYPFVDRGRMLFQVAGHGVQTLVSLGFVDRITARRDLVDRWLSGRIAAPPLSDEPLEPEPAARISKPALGNTLVPVLVLSVVVVPLIVLLPVTLPWAVLAVRRRRYRIESYRVVARWGVIYKRQTSVVFDRIDHIQQHRGMLNKIFGNGDILIYTTGSSATDLAVRHLPDYRAFYDDLRGQYARDEAAERDTGATAQ